MGGTGELDDPLGFGPTYCDLNPNVGGDACKAGFFSGAGFAPEPAHLSTGHAPEQTIAVVLTPLFSPNTAVKEAMEAGVELRRYGSDEALAVEGRWEVTETVVRRVIEPVEPLAEGWYSLIVAESAWSAFGAQYAGFGGPITNRPFPLTDGELRAELRIGSDPIVSRVSVQRANATVWFSETVESDAPPVSVRIGSYDPGCAPDGWTGSGIELRLSCSSPVIGYGDPVSVTIAEGLQTAAGLPLRGPDGETSFTIELPEESTIDLGVPPER